MKQRSSKMYVSFDGLLQTADLCYVSCSLRWGKVKLISVIGQPMRSVSTKLHDLGHWRALTIRSPEGPDVWNVSYECSCMRACVRACVRTYVRTYVMCICLHMCMWHMYVFIHVQAYMSGSICTFTCRCVCICSCICA